jgi:hypothetical protein
MNMKKILHIEGEVQHALDNICDFALKHGGIQAFNFVQKISSSIRLTPDAANTAAYEEQTPKAPPVAQVAEQKNTNTKNTG